MTLYVLLYLGVYARYSMPVNVGIDASQAAVVMRAVRAALEGEGEGGVAHGQKLPGPLWVSVFRKGILLGRHRIEAVTLAGALKKAQAHFSTPQARRRFGAPSGVRLKLDLWVGRGDLVTSIPLLFAKSIVPGVDGLALQADERHAYLLPDTLYSAELLAGYQPFFFMHEFRTGLNIKEAVTMLASRLDLTMEAWRGAQKRYSRFRVQSFLEPLAKSPLAKSYRASTALPVVRHRVPVEHIDRSIVRAAVTRGANYVLRQMQDNGKFRYIYYPLHDKHSGGAYSLPRHAGTTWFLSLAYGHLRDERFGKAARKAIEYLVAHAVPPGCRDTDFACVGSQQYADLGSAGLTTVAIAEYQLATGDKRFEALARRLGSFMTMMQRESGDFCHIYAPDKGKRNCEPVLLYYSGEATLGLARLYQLTGDETLKKPIERALDFLTDSKYDFFMGQFFISEDHWTCIAAEAAYDAVHKESYLEFCQEFARLNRRAQLEEGHPLHDLRGSFGITPFFMPHNTPVGSRSEANVATYLLSQRWGRPDAEVRDTILRAVRFLVDQQYTEDRYYLLRAPQKASGGMGQTPIRGSVRIDYVQHAAAAMVRALPMIPEKPWP
ncbi:MAG: hypothetical protein JRH20_15655 [Deltaproteobacteria bacterium]|nr:hypothetical protein [Deltaproteobacteria bacterium]